MPSSKFVPPYNLVCIERTNHLDIVTLYSFYPITGSILNLIYTLILVGRTRVRGLDQLSLDPKFCCCTAEATTHSRHCRKASKAHDRKRLIGLSIAYRLTSMSTIIDQSTLFILLFSAMGACLVVTFVYMGLVYSKKRRSPRIASPAVSPEPHPYAWRTKV